MMRVYHVKYTRAEGRTIDTTRQDEHGAFGIGVEPEWPRHYEHVAIASAAQTLDEAFVLTNSVDKPWYDSVFVQPSTDARKYRSTSVWDVIVDTANNKVYRVENQGFKEIAEWKGE